MDATLKVALLQAAQEQAEMDKLPKVPVSEVSPASEEDLPEVPAVGSAVGSEFSLLILNHAQDWSSIASSCRSINVDFRPVKNKRECIA